MSQALSRLLLKFDEFYSGTGPSWDFSGVAALVRKLTFGAGKSRHDVH